MTKLPISVCMISGAEERRIGRSIESVAGWTTEIIVVVNEEVADGTAEIARGHGARVFREAWRGYVAQKNSAARKADQEWILGLDADEVVSAELRQEIEQIFAKGSRARECAAFSFPRRTFFCGKWIRHGDWYPDRITRLWRKSAAEWDGRGVHERLSVQGRVGRLRHDLLHYSMESLDHMIRKTLTYSDDFARQVAADGTRVGLADLWARPVWRFTRSYVLRLGFLDGWQGYSIAWLTAFYTFMRYAKARAAQEAAQAHRGNHAV